MRNEHPEILQEIREKKELSDELMERMNKVIKEFVDEFGAAFFHPKNCLISKGGDLIWERICEISKGVFAVLRILNRSPRRWKWWLQPGSVTPRKGWSKHDPIPGN